MTWSLINLFYGLAIGHVGAAYVMYADLPRAVKIIAMIVYAAGFLLTTLRPIIDKI